MPEPIGPTKVVTFYSFKGGVGRTMALVNTAHVLAREGWRVLMVDFDLEAPGMTHFFAKEVWLRPPHVRKDSINFLLDAKHSLEESDNEGREPKYPKSLAEYVVPLSRLPKLRAWMGHNFGRLDLIPATLEPSWSEGPSEGGATPDYLERLGELNLSSLFQEGGPGHRFGDHVRKHFVSARFKAPHRVSLKHDLVESAYDVVFIDSRTGLNEIAGFSIGTIADALVICCGLNQQNIEGTNFFMRKTGLFDRTRAKPFLVVVGPVPNWQTPQVKARLETLQKSLSLSLGPGQLLGDSQAGGLSKIIPLYPVEIVEIPYHPLAALSETVFVTDLPLEPIALAYEELARQIESMLQLRSRE